MRVALLAMTISLCLCGNAWAQDEHDIVFVSVERSYIHADIPEKTGSLYDGDDRWMWGPGLNIGTDKILVSISMHSVGSYERGVTLLNLGLSTFATKRLRLGAGNSFVKTRIWEGDNNSEGDWTFNPYVNINYAFFRYMYADTKIGIGNRSIYSGLGLCIGTCQALNR